MPVTEFHDLAAGSEPVDHSVERVAIFAAKTEVLIKLFQAGAPARLTGDMGKQGRIGH
jgi:hypothetical protein